MPPAVALASVLALAAGCGGGAGTPKRDPRTVESEVGAQSVAVRQMTQVTGRTTAGAPPDGTPSDVSCDEDDDNSPDRQRLQMWSLYGVANTTLSEAMTHLAAGLPAHGWKVVQNGPDSSRNRNQEILAVHKATKIQLDATWMKGLDGHEPLITFYVSSPCFHASPTG
ncbi:hypothetical protein [Streptomyces sp. NBC_01198]|uniref:hypothetical protein n=1 Tax=Streptomyces sp. NBC_01198 TaxID=2903769 RepID=UPI002E157D33|nr:hypothetical protein OG702_20950 [Streptomyces sp. NBC_01198]